MDGLLIVPDTKQVVARQRQTLAAQLRQADGVGNPAEAQSAVAGLYAANRFGRRWMPAKCAPVTASSDIEASAQHMAEAPVFRGHDGLQNPNVPAPVGGTATFQPGGAVSSPASR